MNKKTTIYLIRHAEAQGNAESFFQGNLDTMLTEKGLQQLDFLAERLKDIPFTRIYTSPFQRTVLTAEAVNRFHSLPLTPEYDLRELNGGDWEGRHWSDFPSFFPSEYRAWHNEPWDFCAPNGDAMTEVWLRMAQTLTRIAAESCGKTVAVVSHGCALRNFLCYVEFGDIKRLSDVGWSDNTAVSCVTYDSETGWELCFKQDSSHLPPALSAQKPFPFAARETQQEAENA